ncbi:MAG: hypothetical protein WA421_00640 [Nitrososphaeraceae archaeon]
MAKFVHNQHHHFERFYSEVLDDFRKEMRNCFVDLSRKEAFQLLYKEAWSPEEAAMGNSTLPTVLDKLCMVANINAKKLIELKKAEIKIREAKIPALQEMINSLEQKINDQHRRLDVLMNSAT